MAKGKQAKGEPKVLSMTFVADDAASLRQVRAAVEEALERAGQPVRLGGAAATPWSQSGGWVREADGWSQSGGWYLSMNKQRLDEVYPPLEKAVADVLGALKRVQEQAAKQ
jgi:hypothetical protein